MNGAIFRDLSGVQEFKERFTFIRSVMGWAVPCIPRSEKYGVEENVDDLF